MGRIKWPLIILLSIGFVFILNSNILVECSVQASVTTKSSTRSHNTKQSIPLLGMYKATSSFYGQMGEMLIPGPVKQSDLVTNEIQQQDAIRNPNTNHTYASLYNGEIISSREGKISDTSSYTMTKGIQTQADTLHPSSSYGESYYFRTKLYLPLYLGNRNLTDPQSATFSEDNHFLYVMYVDGTQPTSASQTGWVVRYDWKKLMALGASKSGGMALLRTAAAHQLLNRITEFDRKVLNTVEVGPEFNTGHAQSLALNPKTNELWYIQSYGHTAQNIVARLNAKTLTADAKVTFSMTRFGMGSVLTFDRQGEAYYWIDGKNLQATSTGGNVTLYHGKITTNSVYFTAFEQGIATNPTFSAQSMSFNEASKRFYLVADEGVISFPQLALGKLKTTQIGEVGFSGQRELEGLVFMHNSNTGFLLTNRGPEMMELIPD
ncbi:hypothetical protein [Lactiplantibacillus plantarum]|uniref:hypothetical protein n=1 Tax=Lactiplantibacillus plantarum TaxID=1590 RepID=UPI00097898C2|nr:hypothetical protein [Lactiplantibacillus plantarum]